MKIIVPSQSGIGPNNVYDVAEITANGNYIVEVEKHNGIQEILIPQREVLEVVYGSIDGAEQVNFQKELEEAYLSKITDPFGYEHKLPTSDELRGWAELVKAVRNVGDMDLTHVIILAVADVLEKWDSGTE